MNFVKALNQARMGDKQCVDFLNKNSVNYPMKNGIYIYSTNRKGKELNTRELEVINNPLWEFEAGE